MSNFNDLHNDVLSLKNDKNAKFASTILKTKLKVLGLYTKDIKLLTKKYIDIDVSTFNLNESYEINLLYFSIGLKQIKNFDEQVEFLKTNVYLIDSWAITDSTYQYLKVADFFEALPIIKEFISSDKEFLIRYGYLMLFNYLKDEKYFNEITSLFKNSDYFYVQMVEAWLLSYLFVYFPEKAYKFLVNSKLSKTIKKMTIQKAIDSFRVSVETKDKLKAYRKELKSDNF